MKARIIIAIILGIIAFLYVVLANATIIEDGRTNIPPYNNTFGTTGLLGYWNFEESSGDLIEVYAGKHNGTVGANFNRQQSGIIENSYQSTDINTIIISNSSDFNFHENNELTISAWVFGNNFGTLNNIIFGREDGQFQLIINGSGTPNYVLSDESGVQFSLNGTKLSNNQWYNLIMTTNGSNFTAWLNGENEGSFFVDGIGAVGSDDLEIGKRGIYLIDEFSLINRSINDSEALQIYNSYLGGQSEYSTSTYETLNETFKTNVTLQSGDTISSVKLVYNNVSHSATSTSIGGLNYTLSSSIDIPIGNGTKEFFWKINFGNGSQQNLSVFPQSVSSIDLNLCNATNTINYINFTFKNETDSLENVNATISSSWIYYLGSGTTNKTLSFINASENSAYPFCFSPTDKTLNTILAFDYDNSESQQRTFNLQAGSLTNITTNYVLYLLPTDSGIFSKFQVTDVNGNPISNVFAEISRTISGSSVVVATDVSDDSGFMNIFLNPDKSYSATFSKIGYNDLTFTFTPSSDLRTVILGGTGGVISNGTSLMTNTTYTITPRNSTLLNNTNFVFGFEVTSNQAITLISINITNSSGTQLGYNSNAGTGLVTTTINTGNVSTLIGRYIITSADESFSTTKHYTIGYIFEGDYSLNKQLTTFTQYEFSQFIRILLVLITIMGIMIFLSTNELIDTSESKIVVALMLIYAFSFVGWLDTGLASVVTNQGISDFAQFSNKYGIAILSTGIAFFFWARRIFIRKT